MSAGAVPARGELAGSVVAVLSRGGWGNPDVLLVRHAGRSMVVKDFAPRPAWARWLFGRWLIARERRAYRVLAGLDAVPRLLGDVDGLAIALEYRPGRRLERSLAGELPEDFLPALREAVEAMHRRGVVHLDLRHRSNVLADQAGRPVLLDFASALCLGGLGTPGRLLLRAFARVDHLALRKWEERLAPGAS